MLSPQDSADILQIQNAGKYTARTCLVVVDDSRTDDLSAGRKYLLQFQLRQRTGQTADVQVSVFDALAAWTRVRHLSVNASQSISSSLRRFVTTVKKQIRL